MLPLTLAPAAAALLLFAQPAPEPPAPPPPPPPVPAIAGVVRDAGGLPVPSATVLLCDAASGLPILRESREPLSIAAADSAIEGDAGGKRPAFLTASTDARGHFAFDPPITPGAYRLVAQSWEQSPDFVSALKPGDEPPAAPPAPPHLLTVNGDILHLRGVAPVTVKADAPAVVTLNPLGVESLLIETGAGNDETLLVLSLAPTSADPILAFAGWSGPFMQNIVGATRMPRGVTLVRGLPAGAIHAAVMSADNIPGWGDASIDVPAGSSLCAQIPFVAP